MFEIEENKGKEIDKHLIPTAPLFVVHLITNYLYSLDLKSKQKEDIVGTF